MADRMQELLAGRPDRALAISLPDGAFEQFHEQGFTLLPRVTTDEEIEWLRHVYDYLFSGELEFPPGALIHDVNRPLAEQRRADNVSSQILFPESLYPALRETVFYRNTRRLAGQLLGGELTCWGHMLRKAPGSMDPVPWHQDEAYWDPNFDRDAAACWMPLEDASVENGAMSFIPGSHKGPVLPHGFPGDDPSQSGLVVKEKLPPVTPVPQPVPVGGVSIHHHRVLHMSGPNLTSNPRRAYVNVWNSDTVQRAVPHERPWYWQKKEARDRHNGEAVFYHDASFADVTRLQAAKMRGQKPQRHSETPAERKETA